MRPVLFHVTSQTCRRGWWSQTVVRGSAIGGLLVAGAWLPRFTAAQALSRADTSRVVVLSLTSQTFSNTRGIRVYLPPGYDSHDTLRQYPVVYFNDGFAVFSSRAWRAPETLDSLIRAKAIPPLIVVGIDNAASIPGTPEPLRARANEFLPYPDSTEPTLPNPEGSKYPRFVVEEVMPFIERSFRIRPEPASTGIAGSSYGGIAALTTVLRYPGRFGLLALESTPLFLFRSRLVEESRRLMQWPDRVYVGIGTRETDDPVILGSSALEEFVELARQRLPGSRVRFEVAPGATHTAAAWGARLPVLFTFLLEKPV